MKKVFAWVMALTLIVCAFGAEAETPVRLMYDSVSRLLFVTSNVTLTGHAEFSLDGEHFKTADALYKQDGVNSLWQWKLLTPRLDGSLRESGYTVIANGENVYVMEVFYPGVYKSGTTTESSAILRGSVQLNLLEDLIRILADQSEDLLGKDAILSRSDETGLTVHIQVGEDVPEIVNTALNMAVQFVARRYFDTDYDHVSEQYMGSMGNYLTVTQGILGTTYYMALKSAELELKRDADGNLESADGNMSVALHTENDGIRTLDISFSLDVSDLGGSRVEPFRPEDYGVQPANGAVNTGMWEAKPLDPDTERNILDEAVARWHLAGYPADDTLQGSVIVEGWKTDPENERFHIVFANEDGSVYRTFFTDSVGRVLGLHNMTNNWQNTADDRHFEEYPDQRLVRETVEKLLGYLEEENPELSENGLSLKTDWWYRTGDELYLHFWEGGEPVSHPWDEVDFVVRAEPEWRIEFFSCIANG